MTTISAKVIADSVPHESLNHDTRITTFELRYPRFIHAEVMTHRVFSRNASSSRAIPVEKLIEDIRRHPVVPLHWGKNQPGMQANEEHDEQVNLLFPVSREEAWLRVCDNSVRHAEAFAQAGYHKQIVNRILEPFAHINVVLTATEFTNFFALRNHKDAEPHIRLLAQAMWDAMQASTPEVIGDGGYHLPYIREEESHLPIGTRLKISTARCARVSYKTYDGKLSTVDKDVELYERLVGSDIKHASPAEHQAKPDYKVQYYCFSDEEYHGNFTGWIQHRQMIDGQNITEYDPKASA